MFADETNNPQLITEIQTQLKQMQEASDKQFATLNNQLQSQMQQLQQTLEAEILKANNDTQTQLKQTQQQVVTLQQEVAALKAK